MCVRAVVFTRALSLSLFFSAPIENEPQEKWIEKKKKANHNIAEQTANANNDATLKNCNKITIPHCFSALILNANMNAEN